MPARACPALCRGSLALIAAVAALALSAGALADVIDGDWCKETRHMAIKGPEIMTPAGTQTRGDYSRHTFSYVVPAGDPDAGQLVYMLLVNEHTVQLRMGADAIAVSRAPIQIWLRCAAPVAAAGLARHPS